MGKDPDGLEIGERGGGEGEERSTAEAIGAEAGIARAGVFLRAAGTTSPLRQGRRVRADGAASTPRSCAISVAAACSCTSSIPSP